MPLHKLSDAELRQFCREAIEALEFWLRRLIDVTLKLAHGDNYINALDGTNKNVINRPIRESVQNRAVSDPMRYPRVVDAMLLDDEISIICNPDLYKKYFGEYFSAFYPLGNDSLRLHLKRILDSRNNLSHANPISVRQAEQVICYSHDVIDSIKSRMREKNMHKEYNAPTFIKINDSRGIVYHDAQIRRNATGRGGIDLTDREDAWLRSGETFSVEVEVDPSFPSENYFIKWVFPESVDATINNSKVVIKLNDRNVGVNFTIYCLVTSNEAWHRCGDVDDAIGITYKVLPKI